MYAALEAWIMWDNLVNRTTSKVGQMQTAGIFYQLFHTLVHLMDIHNIFWSDAAPVLHKYNTFADASMWRCGLHKHDDN